MGILGGVCILVGCFIQGIGIILNVRDQTNKEIEPHVKDLEEAIEDLRK